MLLALPISSRNKTNAESVEYFRKIFIAIQNYSLPSLLVLVFAVLGKAVIEDNAIIVFTLLQPYNN